jgi:hypothetical protein
MNSSNVGTVSEALKAAHVYNPITRGAELADAASNRLHAWREAGSTICSRDWKT